MKNQGDLPPGDKLSAAGHFIEFSVISLYQTDEFPRTKGHL